MRFEIAQGDELLSSHPGLALVGEILSSSKLRKRLDRVRLSDHPFPKISHGEVVTAMLGLMCLGKPDFDAIEPFRDDLFFIKSLGLSSVPSSPTLRQRLDSARGALNRILLILRAVCQGSRTLCFSDHPQRGRSVVAIDIDVSPFDNSETKKEGVSWTYYKSYNGYAPIFAYVG